MSRIIANVFILMFLCVSNALLGQSISTELTCMDSDWAFSGSFNSTLGKTSKFSVSNTSRFSSDYLGDEDLHELIISNLAYSLSPKIKSTVGEIFTNSSGIKPTVGMQYSASSGTLRWLLFPNLNISKQPDMMTISMFQWLRDISPVMKFVFRIQSLAILNSGGHVFTTARFRSGLVRKKCQFGLAADLNFFGSSFSLTKEFGVFLQYQLF